MADSPSSSDSSDPPQSEDAPRLPRPGSAPIRDRYDAIVVGLGVMGLATCRELSRRGLRTLGLEQYDLHHDQGCSHGSTRIIRRAYSEHPSYVPLVERAFDLWRDTEEESGQTLLNTCGMLTAGPAKGRIVPPVLATREKYPFDCELLTPGEVNERFPAIGFPLDKDLVAVHEPGGGYLYADRALEAFASSARANGATLLDCHHVRHWTEEPGRVLVESEEGTFEAPFLILTTGPWAKPLLSQFGIEVTLLRKLVFWYLAENEQLIRAGTMPSFAIESPRGIYYGVPDNHDTPEEGLKIGRHDNTPELLEIATLDSGEEMRVERWIDDQEDLVRPMIEAFAREYFAPGLLCGESRELVPSDMAVRQYCLSPDGHFLIGHIPGSSRIAAATGFSGHGFKFAPVVAELLADMAENKPPTPGADFLRLDRLAGSARTGR